MLLRGLVRSFSSYSKVNNPSNPHLKYIYKIAAAFSIGALAKGLEFLSTEQGQKFLSDYIKNSFSGETSNNDIFDGS